MSGIPARRPSEDGMLYSALLPIYRRIIKAVEALLAALVLSLVALVLVQSGCRYFGVSVPWVEEAARASFIWTVMIGAAVSADRRGHYAVQFFVDALRGIPRVLVSGIASLVTIGFLGLLAFLGVRYAQGSASSTFITLGVSRVWAYIAIPIGATLMAMSFARHALVSSPSADAETLEPLRGGER